MPIFGIVSAVETSRGRPYPLGATPEDGGVNFSLFSRHAEGVDLLLFERPDSPEPAEVVSLDPEINRTFFCWHVFVRGLRPGSHYAYRVRGPQEPERGLRFDPDKVLIDPYGRAHTDALWDRAAACVPGSNLRSSMRSVVVDRGGYDWEGDRPLNRPLARTIIYEVHVGGFTRSASSGVTAPGAFRGVIEKIPYLKDLGVTALGLNPVAQFDGKTVLRKGPDGRALRDYWGCGALAFFAPHAGYCVLAEEGRHLEEFRDMVKALHRAGIEVILDVSFGHTDEGGEEGPTVSLRGIDNSLYYHLVPGQPRRYMDYTGRGNMLNCGHPVVAKLILECLESWVTDCHVDGFRFADASVLARGDGGAPVLSPAALWGMDLSSALVGAKLIADSWDAGGLFQGGEFPGARWAQWNGRFRDDIRRFVRGDAGLAGAVASRIAGSADLYKGPGHRPCNSVNFVACHEGFTLNDLVSYNGRQNWANGEDNRDGTDDDLSWDCGRPGETDLPEVERLRERQIRNFAAILLLSQGVPMITAGDEFRRTQLGNNNAWCQDNELSWLDWGLARRHRGVLGFFKAMIAFRKAHRSLQRGRFFDGSYNERGLRDIAWHGCALERPGWDDPEARALAFTLAGFDGEEDLHAMMNMHWEPHYFELPRVPGRRWVRAVDTAMPGPDAVAAPGQGTPVTERECRVDARSVVVLASS
ncbi:MAG: glycogen debranching protein GlgX [Elusimicrobia bacterium]|nr:glycogen debranching protein GlgX [Elusimicrobiota bacterium]